MESTYRVYDMEEIATEAHRLVPQYDIEEYMVWSVREITDYLAYHGHSLFGGNHD